MTFFRRKSDEPADEPSPDEANRGWGPGRLPWVLRETDAGLWIADRVGHSMSLDRAWTIQKERGFEWWAHDLKQRVWADPGEDDHRAIPSSSES